LHSVKLCNLREPADRLRRQPNPHGATDTAYVGTVFGAEPSNCTGGTLTRVGIPFTGAPINVA
ncbi:hypothetical protein, partial [Chthoniobacter flavus]|uniref:hypothetical protein n=1 Tax=Chthoniobacter flavus TaxID=191863 RepID=UPI001A9F7397